MTNTSSIRVVAGRSYTVGAWLETLAATNARVAVSYWTSTLAYQGTTEESIALTGTGDWRQVTFSSRAPAGAAFMRVEIRLSGGGTVWADDVAVTAS
jgi:hypothetical protein